MYKFPNLGEFAVIFFLTYELEKNFHNHFYYLKCQYDICIKLCNQTIAIYEILISNDCSTDLTIGVCENIRDKYPHLPLSIVTQENRLGWVKNCNFLIKKCSGDYFCIIPHDDLIPLDYCEKLLSGFKQYPNAVNCYPVIKCFAEATSTIGNIEH